MLQNAPKSNKNRPLVGQLKGATRRKGEFLNRVRSLKFFSVVMTLFLSEIQPHYRYVVYISYFWNIV